MLLASTGKSPLASVFHLRLQAKTRSADDITDNISVNKIVNEWMRLWQEENSRENPTRPIAER
jgi:hypothetical protein